MQGFDTAITEKEQFRGRTFESFSRAVSIKHLHNVRPSGGERLGELVEYVGVTMDVTEREHAEKESLDLKNAVGRRTSSQ